MNIVGHEPALRPCYNIRRAEVDAVENANQDAICGSIRKLGVTTNFLDGDGRIAPEFEQVVVPFTVAPNHGWS